MGQGAGGAPYDETPYSYDETPYNTVHELFDSLARGQLERFLAGCADDLVLTVRGSGAMTTMVAKAQIGSWYQSMRDLAGASFRSDVCLVLAEDRTQVVLLRHALTRDRVVYQYETVNRCTFRNDQLASWFSHPVHPTDYARAWGIHLGLERQPA
jgi:ketosteroid isomerase-like protein